MIDREYDLVEREMRLFSREQEFEEKEREVAVKDFRITELEQEIEALREQLVQQEKERELLVQQQEELKQLLEQQQHQLEQQQQHLEKQQSQSQSQSPIRRAPRTLGTEVLITIDEPDENTDPGNPLEDSLTTILEDDGPKMDHTPQRSYPRQSIGQWSTERIRNNMSVKSLVNSLDKRAGRR